MKTTVIATAITLALSNSALAGKPQSQPIGYGEGGDSWAEANSWAEGGSSWQEQQQYAEGGEAWAEGGEAWAEGGDSWAEGGRSQSVSAVEGSGNSRNQNVASSQLGQTQSTESLSSAEQSQVNEGNSLSTGYEYTDDSKYLALALPGAAADYGSTAPCLESRRGWTFAGFGASGRTKPNEECLLDQTDKREFAQCMMLADSFVKLGLVDHAVAQLRQCGGVTVEDEPFGEDYVTREHLNRMYETLQQK